MALAAIGRAGQPPPDIAALFRLPACSCGFWWKSNGLRSGQRPGGRRYDWLLSWAFRGWGPASGGGSGVRSGTRLRFCRSRAWHSIGPRLSECSNSCLLPAPPAGFEPALTAPERVAVYASGLRKRARGCPARARIGRGLPVRAAGKRWGRVMPMPGARDRLSGGGRCGHCVWPADEAWPDR